MTGQPDASASQWLTLSRLLAELAKHGLVERAQARELNHLYKAGGSGNTRVHPIVWLANAKLKSQKPPHEVLGVEALTRFLAQFAGLPYFRIDPLKVDVDAVTENMSKAYAQRHRILPVAVTDSTVTFATAEPFRTGWSHDLGRMLNREIKCVVANPLDIARYQEEFFGISHSLRKARKGSAPVQGNAFNNVEALVELGKTGNLDANDSHIVSIVDWMLQYAFQQRASDIHIEPRRDKGQIRFRIDGDLHVVYEMPAGILIAVTSRIKALGRMDVVDKRRPQDGRVKTMTPAGKEVELRLSTMPTAFGEKLVMRIFDPDVLVSDMSELGFSPSDAATWEEMTRHTHGIILVTGPTGSGKTTTLYSTLKSLYRPEINICTIEDPIEMVEPLFNQMQVNHTIGVDFAAGVRTLLRQDPDVVMVGEIRDLETANMAIQAALTGHLVLSTLHTNDSVSAITRLTEIGVPAYLINATVIGVVAQRLVRKLCLDCRKSVEVEEDIWQALVHEMPFEQPPEVFESEGCDECRGTGYKGRVGIYEMLRVNAPMRSLVKQDSSVDEMRAQAARMGVETLRISGARKVAAGLTSIAEVMRVTPAADDL
jgi:general secretion pathway protein E